MESDSPASAVIDSRVMICGEIYGRVHILELIVWLPQPEST
jgi:hypothetical protein